MSQNIQYKLIILLLFILLINTFVLKSASLDIILAMLIICIVVYANRKTLKELKVGKILGVLLLFISTIAILVSFFYFIASPLSERIATAWLRSIVQVLFTIGALIPAITLLYKGIYKITNGAFPVIEIEDEEIKEYPVNEDVEQLVQAGKVIEAVKRARELYGYSLVQAKKYIDSLR